MFQSTLHQNWKAALENVARVPRWKRPSWQGSGCEGRWAWAPHLCAEGLRLTTRNLGSPDLHSQSLQQSLFWTRFPTSTKAPHNLETFIFNLWGKAVNKLSHCHVTTCRTRPGHKRSLVLSKWPLLDCHFYLKTIPSNQPPGIHLSTRHFYPSARKTYISPDFTWLWSCLF